jgi:hypothetical protein
MRAGVDDPNVVLRDGHNPEQKARERGGEKDERDIEQDAAIVSHVVALYTVGGDCPLRSVTNRAEML